MAGTMEYTQTRQGMRDLNHPVRLPRSTVNVGPNERAASTIGGAVIAGLGVSQGGWAGLALAALGGALAYRGATGHCTVYSALGVNSAR
ncbi:Cyclase/dehydrase OS=Fibrisoma limi BUZ 3 GN=BN8_05322 PE=4 SV=1: DUF2892 [Gemmata massiliana]|uniref:Inner membrane protein YgaP-like transmembrane domain-containing protein n=1 Tax=Gemmata massiliana TaxID=1210884 RepID=A0A6P2D4C2_9BACT|nr:DUF2892 domain-containing protein [Gemmata massiliana]VTR96151.1 Cyclase/dehydrase OS=Fibrisoma limi BUZ 3 GN=BN8_05322 PE=4 SV=1: DUF2892 [Gemmata massiliana]